MQWLYIVLSFPVGLLLGGFFFGGLWWSVQKLSTVRNPALLFMVSFIVRTTVVMAGFYVLLMQGLLHLLIALGGYLVARTYCLRTLMPAPAVVGQDNNETGEG